MATINHTTHALIIGKKDDERARMSETLLQLGYNVIAVDSAESALTQCVGCKPDFIFVDCQIPCCGGRTILDRMRDSGLNVPRSLLVAYTIGTAEACLEHNCPVGAILQKPINREQLSRLIATREVGPTADEVLPSPSSRPENQCPNGISMQSLLTQFDQASAYLIVQAFVTDTAGRLERIAEALRVSDWEIALRQIHAIKSGSLQVGSGVMVSACNLMQAALKSRAYKLAGYCFNDLRGVFEEERNSLHYPTVE
jgi:CheY-like chemotaxis protein